MTSQKNESSLMRRYVSAVVRHRLIVITCVIIVTILLASRLMSLKIDMDQDTWVPQAHPYVKTTKQIEKVFGGRNVTIIGIVPKQGDIYQPNILAKIQRIQAGIEQIPGAIRHNVASLAARKIKDIKGTADGMVVTRMLETVPQTPDELAKLRQKVEENPIYINALVSPDGKSAAVIADFKVDTSKPSYALLYEEIRKVTDLEADNTVDIYFGGLPIDFAWFEQHMMKMPLYFGIALLIIMVIQYWSFRSIQGMLLPILTALLSVVWSLGIMGAVGVHMDGMNTTTPILIMAMAAGHSIQILKRYYEEYHRLSLAAAPESSKRALSNAAVIESIVRVGPVMITAGVIAAITFYSLVASGVSAAQHFGVFAGSGVLSAMVLEMTLVPAMRSLLPPPSQREKDRERRHDLLDRLLLSMADRLTGGRAPVILLVSTAVVLLVFSGVYRLQVDNSLKHYSKEGSEVRIHDAALNERFGGTNSIFFLVEGPDGSLKDPKVLGAISTLQAFLEKQPYVGKTQSIADLVKRMNQAMHGDNAAFHKIPDQADLIAQYLFLYTLSGDPQDFDSLVDNEYARAAVWVFVKTDSTSYAQSLHEKASGVIAGAFPPGVSVRMGGSLPQTIAGNEELTQGKFTNIAQMAAVVFVLGSLALRSLVGGLFVVTPLIMVVLANFGLMGWLGVPLDMGTATTAAMAIGVGADYELYLLFRFREELARTGSLTDATRISLLTSGKAVLFVALSVALGYAALLTSGFGFYTRLAIMVISTMIVSAAVALIFLRAMMVTFRPKFIFGERATVGFAKPPGSIGD